MLNTTETATMTALPSQATMDRNLTFEEGLGKPDDLVLKNLKSDIRSYWDRNDSSNSLHVSDEREDEIRDKSDVAMLQAMNNPDHAAFEPTVFASADIDELRIPPLLNLWIVQPYIRSARSAVRVETDVVMITHLILYFTTSLPSALFLFWRFTWIHGLLHVAMQSSYLAAYSLMMHQHVHMHGILKRKFVVFDYLFPYIIDPLMGHTWNSFYYQHVKHHHVEGNGPGDISSTLRYQRDNPLHLLHYIARFIVSTMLEIPLYFFRANQPINGMKMAFWELATYAAGFTLKKYNSQATLCVFVFPYLILRVAIIIENWGQHAFVDPGDPNSDYRSSITLISAAVNRHGFNDGYHTSHHLNSKKHWREHPVSFLKNKHLYASQQALVFHGTSFHIIAFRLLLKDYEYLARRMVPIGKQMGMTLEERIALLKKLTRPFTEEELQKKFK